MECEFNDSDIIIMDPLLTSGDSKNGLQVVLKVTHEHLEPRHLKTLLLTTS